MLHRPHHHFSLTKLFIYMVVIGLVVAGTLTSHNLIHQAGLKGISKDIKTIDFLKNTTQEN